MSTTVCRRSRSTRTTELEGPPAPVGGPTADLPPTIVTARLELVPLRVADADEMVDVLADPTLYRFIGGGPPTRVELVARYRTQVAGRSADGREEWRNWIVRERSGRAATGFVQATITGDGEDRTADVAWVIGVGWQGRGYATEAASGLVRWLDSAGVREIVAHVHPDHAASAAVAGRIGLEPTDLFVDGERRWRRVRPRSGSGS
jgi:RimJ/RimL family protein N-acetyltransferase